MARKIIATVRLAAGQAGYYDELTGVYMTLSNRNANIYADMNTKSIKSAVRNGKLFVTSGSLTPTSIEEEKEVIEMKPLVPATPIVPEQEKEPAVDETVTEQSPDQLPEDDQVTEEPVALALEEEAEPVAKAAPKKKSTKKKEA